MLQINYVLSSILVLIYRVLYFSVVMLTIVMVGWVGDNSKMNMGHLHSVWKNIFLILKISEKVVCTYILHVLCVRRNFREETTLYFTCVKKIKSCAIYVTNISLFCG